MPAKNADKAFFNQHKPNLRWSTDMDTTVSIRASSLPELFDCPARWAAKHLRGMRMPMSGNLRG